MTHIKPVKRDTDVKEVLEEGLKLSDNLDGVILIGLHKDGSQILITSNMSQYEKLFLKAFMDAWSVKWFNLEEM